MQLFNSLWEQMRSQGFVVDSKNVSFTGEYTRFPRDSSGPNAWLKIDYDEKLNYARAEYGDWKSGEKYSWTSDSETERDHERDAEIAAFLAKRQEENDKRKAEGYAAAREEATKIVTTFDESPSPYLERKGLAGLEIPGGGTRAGVLYVPAYSEAGLAGFQKILPDGGKYFQPGMEIRGSFCPLPALGDDLPARIFVAEGIATAGSIWKAFDGAECVVACFNAGNMKAVVQTLKAHGRGAQVIACGDEDILTKVRGQWKNPGREAATSCGADKVVFPGYMIGGPDKFYGSDQNDAHLKYGLEWVRTSIEEQLGHGQPYSEPTYLRPPGPGSTGESQGAEDSESGAAGTGEGPAFPGERDQPPGEGGGPESSDALPAALPRPLEWPKGKNGPEKPTQKRIADALQAQYGLNLVKSGKDVFKWDETHWKLCEQLDHDTFFRQASALGGPKFKAGELNAIVEIFLKSLRHVPPDVNMFESRSDRANFLNGTLHLSFRPKSATEMAQDPAGATHWFSTDFRPHNREDYCVNVIKLEYRPHAELPVNEEFEKVVRGWWPDSDPEQAAKIRLYKQVMGSALVPIFPMLFFFLGQSKTGKSTALILIRHLIDNANVSRVDPANWGKEFYLEGMAGKLANIVTDISTDKKFSQEIPKLIIDREPVLINRKGLRTVNAMLPAFHAFGVNEMPPTYDANSGAFDRRIIIVKTNTVQAGEGGGNTFASWLWNQGREGILKAALEGLEDLLANGGRFSEPGSSKEERSAWLEAGDLVGGFVATIKEGGIRLADKGAILKMEPEMKISSDDLYRAFNAWAKDIGAREPGIGGDPRRSFGKRFGKRSGLHSKPVNGVRYWFGVGVNGDGAQY